MSGHWFLAKILDSGEEHVGMLHKNNDNSLRSIKLSSYSNRYAVGEEINLSILKIDDDKKIQFFIP